MWEMKLTVGEFLAEQCSRFWFECMGGDATWIQYKSTADSDRNLTDTLLYALGIDPEAPVEDFPDRLRNL